MSNPFLTQFVVGAALTSTLAAGCLSSGYNAASIGAADAGAVVVPDMAVDIQADFAGKVAPLLRGDCGACHSQSSGGVGPGFLAGPDMLASLLSFPGLIGPTPESSRILLKDPHAQPATYHPSSSYTPSPTLVAHAKVIADWITLYNQLGGASAGTDMAVGSRIEPFLPADGMTKSIDLGVLNAALAGTKLGFRVDFIGTTQVKLSNITVSASASVGVHLKTPLFATYAAADPNTALLVDYDYLSDDVIAYQASTAQFSPSLVIFSYTPGQLLNASFATVEAAMGAPDMGGALGACKNVAGFTAWKPNVMGALGLNCSSCHDGGNGGFSTAGFTNNANDATSCAGTLPHVNPTTPNMSELYLEVTGPAAHPGGKLSTTDAAKFLTALTTWVNGEK